MNKLWCAFCVFLVGCSQSTVHLNNRYLNEQQTTQIVQIIEQSGAKIKLNQHPFPQRVNSNTLIYSPMHRQPDLVNQLQRRLISNGWNIPSTIIMVESNQWFTKSNIGLFLVPDGVEVGAGRTPADIAQTYQSLDCTDSFQLQLLLDGGFRLQGESLATQIYEGSWRITGYPYLQLYNDEPYFNYYYKVAQTQAKDMIGTVNIITLQPLSNSRWLPNCKLEYGVRD